MSKRFTDTEIWDKEWFMSLSPKLKLLIKFIQSKCDAAGVWAPNFTLASAYIGEPVSYADISMFGDQLEILSDGKIFIPEFISFQYGTLSEKCKPHLKVLSLIEKHGLSQRVAKGYGKGIQRVGEGYTKGIHTLEEKEEDKDIVYNTELGNTCVITHGGNQNFFDPSQIPQIEPFRHVHELANEYLNGSKYAAAREQLCMSLHLSPNQLIDKLSEFNQIQVSETKSNRQMSDWVKHFRNWMRKTATYNSGNSNPSSLSDDFKKAFNRA